MAANTSNNSSSAAGVDIHAFIGKKPNRIIPIPHEFRRFTLMNERNTLVNDIKVNTGCDVLPRWEHGKIYQFYIFGSGAGLDQANREINQWIEKAHTKSKDSSKWAKTRAFDPDEWYYKQVEGLENDRKRLFKGPVPVAPEGEAPFLKIIVDWPQDMSDQSITPRDVFGNKLEALDSMRMQDEVFIVLLPGRGGTWQIEILGYDTFNVEAADSHLSTLIDSIRNDSMGLQSTLNMILDDLEGIDVVLRESELWWPFRNDRIVPHLIAHRMMNEPGTFRQESLHPTQLSKIQHSFQLALEAVRPKKGAYDMSIRLGRLVINSKHVKSGNIGHTYHKDSFLKQINGMVGLEVKNWLADNERGRQILSQLMSAEDILEPAKSANYFGSSPASLKQTRPRFRGTWVFRDPSNSVAPLRVAVRHPGRPAPLGQNSPSKENPPPPASLLVVQVDWADDDDGRYEKIASRFFKLEHSNHGPKENMDINLLELGEYGSRAWRFALESLIPLSSKTVSPLLTGFANRVKMRAEYDISSDQQFVELDQVPNVRKHLEMSRLESIYSFGVKQTGYRVEFSAMWYPEQKLPVWGLALRHSEWATHLAELERLPDGHQADWGHIVSTFLPDDGQTLAIGEDLGMNSLRLGRSLEAPPRNGIRILTDKLMQLSAIVSTVTYIRDE